MNRARRPGRVSRPSISERNRWEVRAGAMNLCQLVGVLGALAAGTVNASAAAQVGVYEDDEPRSLGEARRSREGIRISGRVRGRIIPRVYTVRRGDTLWDVTGRFYGNPWEWPRVWSFNPEITNPHWIYPLDQLRLLAPDTEPPPPVGDAGPRIVQVRPARGAREGTVYLRQEGYLDEEALQQAGVVVGSPEDHMLLAPYDPVYIEFDESVRERPSGEYTIFREIATEERGPSEEGTLVRIFGTVRIDSYDAEQRTARATIIEALDPIERGYRVAPMPRRFDMVPPRPADRDLESRVAATLRPRELLGDQQIVFVPHGREDGVAVGNRFFIVRSGDQWRDELASSPNSAGASVEAPERPEEYPTEIVAEGRVVHVRPNSATLMITRAVHPVEVGDRAEMRRGY